MLSLDKPRKSLVLPQRICRRTLLKRISR